MFTIYHHVKGFESLYIVLCQKNTPLSIKYANLCIEEQWEVPTSKANNSLYLQGIRNTGDFFGGGVCFLHSTLSICYFCHEMTYYIKIEQIDHI